MRYVMTWQDVGQPERYIAAAPVAAFLEDYRRRLAPAERRGLDPYLSLGENPIQQATRADWDVDKIRLSTYDMSILPDAIAWKAPIQWLAEHTDGFYDGNKVESSFYADRRVWCGHRTGNDRFWDVRSVARRTPPKPGTVSKPCFEDKRFRHAVSVHSPGGGCGD